MQDKKTGNIVKVGILLIILGAGYPIYALLDSTIQKKRKNAIKNATKKWAPEALLDCAWRYEISMRNDNVQPIYEEWILMYGSDEVVFRLYPERAEEIEEWDGDDEHKFSPPRINKEAPHAKTPEVLYQLAHCAIERRNKPRAQEIINVAADSSLFPTLNQRLQSKIFKLQARLRN